MRQFSGEQARRFVPQDRPDTCWISNGADLLPLVVDLDGTLIKTDLLAETASSFLLAQPFRSFKLLVWLAQGKSVLKARLAQSTPMDAAALPYNKDLLTWLQEEKAKGRRIVLATASHRLLADQVAAHLGLFDDVLTSDDVTNLKAAAKRDVLVGRYGERGFDYVGDDWADVPVWQSAAQAHVVSRSARLIGAARAQGNLGRTLMDGKPTLAAALLKAMRPHQWMKNLLVLIPLLAAHRYGDVTSVLQALLAFLAFGLTASSVYLLNDLVDLTDDRHHPRKRQRPFAAGHLGLTAGWLTWPALVVLSFALSILALPWPFTVSLAFYFITTLAYSLRLKQVPMVDVMTLALLYTMRIIAGAAAIAVPLSFWLLSFSMFIFLSLALVKRYSELKGASNAEQGGRLRGRGYDAQDLSLVAILGGSAGYTAVLVLALYIQDSHTAALYASPEFIWVACPLLLFWVSRVWLITHRGQMHDDPIVFALKDRVSWGVAILVAAVFILAKVVT
jgi:4-hydroxybenzoate polyprenyltransferase/phosphoserine phosphatase